MLSKTDRQRFYAKWFSATMDIFHQWGRLYRAIPHWSRTCTSHFDSLLWLISSLTAECIHNTPIQPCPIWDNSAVWVLCKEPSIFNMSSCLTSNTGPSVSFHNSIQPIGESGLQYVVCIYCHCLTTAIYIYSGNSCHHGWCFVRYTFGATSSQWNILWVVKMEAWCYHTPMMPCTKPIYQRWTQFGGRLSPCDGI